MPYEYQNSEWRNLELRFCMTPTKTYWVCRFEVEWTYLDQTNFMTEIWLNFHDFLMTDFIAEVRLRINWLFDVEIYRLAISAEVQMQGRHTRVPKHIPICKLHPRKRKKTHRFTSCIFFSNNLSRISAFVCLCAYNTGSQMHQILAFILSFCAW